MNLIKSIVAKLAVTNSVACGDSQDLSALIDNSRDDLKASIQMVAAARASIAAVQAGEKKAAIFEGNKYLPVMQDIGQIASLYKGMELVVIYRGEHSIVMATNCYDEISNEIAILMDKGCSDLQYVNTIGSLLGYECDYNETAAFIRDSECRCVLCTGSATAPKYDWVLD